MIHLTKALVRRWLDTLLHVHDTPERTAAAFALGCFIGFSPFLGLHTLIAITLAFVFNLNRVAALLGVYSNLPWILPAYYTLATTLGATLLQYDIPPGFWKDLREVLTDASWGEFRTFTKVMMAPLIWSYALGSMIGAVALAVTAYRASLTMIVAHRRHLATVKSSEHPH